MFGPLVGYSGRTVSDIYCSAFFKAVLFNLPLHYSIAFVGIYPDVVTNGFAIVNCRFENPVNLPITCNSMQCHIWFIIKPISIFNILVCWFQTINKYKDTMRVIIKIIIKDQIGNA